MYIVRIPASPYLPLRAEYVSDIHGSEIGDEIFIKLLESSSSGMKAIGADDGNALLGREMILFATPRTELGSWSSNEVLVQRYAADFSSLSIYVRNVRAALIAYGDKATFEAPIYGDAVVVYNGLESAPHVYSDGRGMTLNAAAEAIRRMENHVERLLEQECCV